MTDPIKGYRTLNDEEIALINRIKYAAEEVGGLLGDIQRIFVENNGVSVDQRWAAEAKTDLQKGFMSLVRAIAQPTTF